MVRHVYRDLLKAVRRHAKGNHFAGFVSQEFRNKTALKDPYDVGHKLDLAKDYSFLVRSVYAHKVASTCHVLCFFANFPGWRHWWWRSISHPTALV